MKSRKYIYVFCNVHNTTSVVNYDASNNDVNTFLSYFDIWGSRGEFKLSEDEIHQEVWFECSKNFYRLAKTGEFKKAFKKMGVSVSLEYPFIG